ncbi:hypothetical protein C7H79_02495 [Nitrosomonas supralitoralis]|uniref:CD-NTase-associated protein 12/Pycsar effector protein TIR domain-containing protein n=1 Tax=Nitrosomonas supralitoralis TaxID=2116706 RepID=A0A2P7NYI9_9PROT|nr:hypothetical protein C7H79_02495 [Nitrosomonas supralitoralis]
MKIFYSWQSDIDSKYNRNFQIDCIKAAIKKLNRELELREPIRSDHDTKDVPGSPDITSTILQKIESSDVFLGDITFITFSEKRFISNPNVLIELGYALHCLGDVRVINIMNTAFGEPDGNIPFDLAHKRWPITYLLNEDNYSDKAIVKKELTSKISAALSPYINKPKISGPKFDNNGEKIRHQEKIRSEIGSYIQRINAGKLRRKVIIRDIDRAHSYPEIIDGDGISPWFKVELAQTYHRGVQVFLQAGTLVTRDGGNLRFRNLKAVEKGDLQVFLVGEIPFSNIEVINWEGDEYDYFPHFYCHFFGKSNEPYERIIFCTEVDMGNGHKYYSEVDTFENVQKNSGDVQQFA